MEGFGTWRLNAPNLLKWCPASRLELELSNFRQSCTDAELTAFGQGVIERRGTKLDIISTMIVGIIIDEQHYRTQTNIHQGFVRTH